MVEAQKRSSKVGLLNDCVPDESMGFQRHLLGHKTMAMTGRYVEKVTEPLRAAADAVSGRVAAAMNGQYEAEVVELRKSPA